MWYVILPTCVVAFFGFAGWVAWLVFNAWVFSKTEDPSAFEKTSSVARSFRRPSAVDTVKELRPALRGRRKLDPDGESPASESGSRPGLSA